MRLSLTLVLAALLCGCQLIYKLPTRQGNVLEQKQIDQLQTGMTRDQVKYLLGTPIAASPFRADRWDYVGYYKSPRGQIYNRTVSVYFDAEGKVTRMEGIKLADADKALETPDFENVVREEKKAKTEEERAKADADAGPGVFSPQPADPAKPEPAQVPNP